MNKCHVCGKKALEVVEICPECLRRAAVAPEHIKRLKQISSILNITPGNMRECLAEFVENTDRPERER